MSTRVEFFELGPGEPARALFAACEMDARILVSGPCLADAIVVLQRPLEVAERRIERQSKPLDWIAHLTAAYDQDALRATAPEREERSLLEILQRERTLLAFRDAREFFYLQEAAVRDAGDRPVSLSHYRHIVEGERWEVLVPLAEVLEALSPDLPLPSLDELTRDFFAELEHFRREYSNWTSLYRRGEVWRKVLFGTPPEQRPRHVQEIDTGLLGRVGRRYYPRIEQGGLGTDQLWRAPAAPGAPLATAEAACIQALGQGATGQALLDLARLKVPTKILLTRTPAEKAQGRAAELREILERSGGPTEDERYFIVLAPPDAAPTGPWHLIKSEPASGEPWLFSAWG